MESIAGYVKKMARFADRLMVWVSIGGYALVAVALLVFGDWVSKKHSPPTIGVIVPLMVVGVLALVCTIACYEGWRRRDE